MTDEMVKQRINELGNKLYKLIANKKDNENIHQKTQAKKMGFKTDSNLVKYCKGHDLDKKTTQMGVGNLIRICEYYNVSADYMLGFTTDKKIIRDSDVDDKLIRAMCDYTGLSRQAIEALHKKKDDFLFSAGLSYLLSSKRTLLSSIIEYILTCLHDVTAADKRYSRLPGISSASEAGKHFFYDVFEELPQAREHFYQLVMGNEALRERYAQEMAFKCVNWDAVSREVYPYLSYSPELSAEECYKKNLEVDQGIFGEGYHDDYDPSEFQNPQHFEPDENDPATIYHNQCENALEDLRIHLAEKNNAKQ